MTIRCYKPETFWEHLKIFGCKQNDEYTNYYFDDEVTIWGKDEILLPIPIQRVYSITSAHKICDAFKIEYPSKEKVLHGDFRD